MNDVSITFAGVDIRTDILSLPLGYEYGVLYTETPEGRNRYPDYYQVISILDQLHKAEHYAALHVCGTMARAKLLDGALSELIEYVQRVQINGILSIQYVQSVCERYDEIQIITQHNEKNVDLLDVVSPNHAVLIDASGGRGFSPQVWSRPQTEKPVGFAGGLGPDTIVTELPKICSVAEGDWWIDMENNIRTDDWFDIEKVNNVVSYIWQA